MVNDYWFKSWNGAKLTYRLRTRDGKVVKDLTRIFDLPLTPPSLSFPEKIRATFGMCREDSLRTSPFPTPMARCSRKITTTLPSRRSKPLSPRCIRWLR